ncbi:MAG: 4-hydroxybenzoate octaprenyltransferase [Rhodospirillaceae bacterium]|nr:4-hydroxybenzoate octaprenyltransferase [Rhodospirillaceae bacterium]
MSQAQTAKTDIPAESWVENALPMATRPYARLMRLDRPIGTWLLLWPCWWALALSGPGLFAWHIYVLFGIGAVVMRGAGCTYNDIIDRDIDARVARTASRPLPSGQVTVVQACVFLTAQLAVGFLILVQFNTFAIWVGASSLLLVASYPFMKRITYWPQAWLGLTFNWGALLGWAVAKGELEWPALLLYAGGIAWTLGYDTIYAHQDREDDALIGVKSSALALGARSKSFIAACYVLAIVLFTVAIQPAGWAATSFLIMALAAGHAAWQVITLNIDDAANCLVRFRSNRDFGALVMLALLFGQTS